MIGTQRQSLMPGAAAGTPRQSIVAGAAEGRNSRKSNVANAENYFTNSLRDGDEQKQRSISRSLQVLPTGEVLVPVNGAKFSTQLKLGGFKGDPEIVFREAQKETPVDGLQGRRSINIAEATITFVQMQSLERRPGLLMVSLAELLRLKRGSVLRSWQLDVDHSGVGSASKKDFYRLCRMVGFEDQANVIWGSVRPYGNVDRLHLVEFCPEEAKNATLFAHDLMCTVLHPHDDPYEDFDDQCSTEKVWSSLVKDMEGFLTISNFRDVANRIGFDRQVLYPAVNCAKLSKTRVRPVFDGLDTSGYGRLWPEDFQYLWTIAEATHGVEMRGKIERKKCEKFKKLDCSWEPSEFERNAREFAIWTAFAGSNWESIYSLFVYEMQKINDGQEPGIRATELERFLHMIGYFGDIGAIFIEIGREVAGPPCHVSLLTFEKLKAWRFRRNKIVLDELHKEMVTRRGTVLRSWRLDVDLKSCGFVDQRTFFDSFEKMNVGDDLVCVWDLKRMSNRSDVTARTLMFEEFAPEEAANMQSFGEALLEKIEWDLEKAWYFFDTDGDHSICYAEFLDGLDRLHWHGDAKLLYGGLASNPVTGELCRTDFDYIWAVVILAMRVRWVEPPLYARRGASADRGRGGVFNLLGIVGLDYQGLDYYGEQITEKLLNHGLTQHGYSGASFRAAREMIFKVLTGEEACLMSAARGFKTCQLDLAARPPFHHDLLTKYARTYRQVDSRISTKMVGEGDYWQGRTRRLNEWHQLNQPDLHYRHQENLRTPTPRSNGSGTPRKHSVPGGTPRGSIESATTRCSSMAGDITPRRAATPPRSVTPPRAATPRSSGRDYR